MATLAGYDQSEIRNTYLDEDKQNVFQMLNPKSCEGFFQSIPDDKFYIIKTHGSFCSPIKLALANGKVKALASYRDPLDIAISLLDAGRKERLKVAEKQREFAHIYTLDDTIKAIDWSVAEADKWLSDPHVKNIPYSNILNTPESVATELQDFFVLGEHATAASSKYLSNKEKILEYNVGGIGRWRNRLTNREANQLMDRYKDFRAKWILE